MDIFIPVVTLIIGLIVGALISRYFYSKETDTKASLQAEANVKSLMSEQASAHINQTKQSIAYIKKQCADLERELTNYENLLTDQPAASKANHTPFYSEEATTYLRNNLATNKNEQTTLSSSQPKDFANTGSGLFVGEVNSVASSKED